MNGRNIAILFDREFVVSPSGVYRRISDGACGDIDWTSEGDYIIKDGNLVKVINSEGSGVEARSFKPGYQFEGVFGGPLL